jgi:hypothetical protein
MAAETPFGLSFGNPGRYMGSSPLAEVGKAIKTGLIGYGIQESGLENWLNEKGMKKNKQGGYEYSAPAGSVPPITSGSTGVNADGVWGQNPMPVSPMTFTQTIMPVDPDAVSPQTAPPMLQSAPVNFGPPPDIGNKILDNDWHGESVDVSNKSDFNPLPIDTGNQVRLTGNEYQQVPGYGSTEKAIKAFLPFLMA